MVKLIPYGIRRNCSGRMSLPSRRRPDKEHLRHIMIARFGRDELVLGESVPLPEGKFRYFRDIRQEMYRELIGLIRRHFGEQGAARIELAMEPGYIWRNTGLTG
jgi:hypothetical protein